MRRGAIAVIVIAAVVVAAAAGDATTTGSPPPAVDLTSYLGVPPVRLPARAAIDWCGTGQPAAVDRKPDVDRSSTRQVHVTYVVPADGADQLAGRAGPIATDISAIDGWWRGQDASRSPRFDLFAFPGCSSRFGQLDIGFVRLPRAGSLYVGNTGFFRLLTDLTQLAALPAEKHLVYYDGPNPFEDVVCGATPADRANPTQGGLTGVAVVFLRSPCTSDLGAASIAADVAVHELVHGLGAFVQGGPNDCDPPNDGHACDSSSDLMYPFVSPLSSAILDVNHDDYYGHAGTWFDVQDSAWLSHLPQVGLSVSVTGEGGTVRMTSPTAAGCGRACTLQLDQGTVVGLVATPAPGARFAGWGGSCSGTSACTVTLGAATSVTARFARSTSRVLVRVTGKGTVASSPVGISCPKRCTATFATGATIRLRPQPAKGFRFAGWSGACRGTAACLLPVDRDRVVRAVFR